MRLLIGIDDTDNKESRGTGFKARQLAKQIEEAGFGTVKGITRHQLYVHDDIAYTSQNSSACLDVDSDKFDEIKLFCAEYLKNEAAEGSDAGLCIAEWDTVSVEIRKWGERAKKEVLNLNDAIEIAKKNTVYLEGFTGTLIGQIGALAAVGLRKEGNDGRFIWLRGVRELRDFDAGVYTVKELKQDAGIDKVQTKDGIEVPENERVNCNGWTRPILLKNSAVLLVENSNFADYGWKTSSKEYIRTIS
ncbi:MAG: hypothetical protein R2764_15475 [Bacteroidales bacterium]